jgi:ribosomal protein S18 acetylase RimI-like enzyme
VGVGIYGKSSIEFFPEDGEIHTIYLSEPYTGIGIGHMLFVTMEDTLYEAGYEALSLYVLSQNEHAVNFYLDHGYQIAVTDEENFGGKFYQVYVMRKDQVSKGKQSENEHRP